jgi:hypothetical protein
VPPVPGTPGAAPPVVVGFAETATGLGHAVAAAAGAAYLHTTRRPAPPGAATVSFLEEHSHAVDQTLVAADDTALCGGGPLVLVDDELSTGRTALNAIRALHARWPRRRYVLACLLDSRAAAPRTDVTVAVGRLGAELDCVTLTGGTLDVPPDVLTRADALRAAPGPRAGRGPVATGGARTPVHWYEAPTTLPWAALGWGRGAAAVAASEAARIAARLDVPGDAGTLVLGDEELMYLPQLVAAALGPQTRTSTTTRSPALVVDAPGYPLRTRLDFPATGDPGRISHAYNVAPSGLAADPGNAPGFDHIVLVSDASRAALDGHPLVGLLAGAARRHVHIVTVPALVAVPAGRSGESGPTGPVTDGGEGDGRC